KLGSERGRHPEYRVEELAKDDGAQPEPIAFDKVMPKDTPFGIGRGTISRPSHNVLQNGDRLAKLFAFDAELISSPREFLGKQIFVVVLAEGARGSQSLKAHLLGLGRPLDSCWRRLTE